MDYRKMVFVFVLFGVLLVFGMSAGVSALSVGIAGDIEAYPGQTLDRIFDIQNLLDGARDVTLEGRFLEGGEVISFIGGIVFDVPAGSVIPVSVRIVIPGDAVVGTEYRIQVLFESTTGGTGDGSVAFAENVGRSFVVRVSEAPSLPSGDDGGSSGGLGVVWIVVLIVIVVVVIAYFVLRGKGKGKGGEDMEKSFSKRADEGQNK